MFSFCPILCWGQKPNIFSSHFPMLGTKTQHFKYLSLIKLIFSLKFLFRKKKSSFFCLERRKVPFFV